MGFEMRGGRGGGRGGDRGGRGGRGGGRGGNQSYGPTAGGANTGGGGGGATGAGAAGGSGIVLLIYPTSVTATFSAGVTSSSSTYSGNTVTQVTAAGPSDTVTFG